MCSGNTASAHGINTEGLKRRGFSSEAIAAIRRGYKTLYRSNLTLPQARDALREQAAREPHASDALGSLVGFLDGVTRGIVR
jgi:UDP-N-acetylglucosamine acyltransferase